MNSVNMFCLKVMVVHAENITADSFIRLLLRFYV